MRLATKSSQGARAAETPMSCKRKSTAALQRRRRGEAGRLSAGVVISPARLPLTSIMFNLLGFISN